jgi:hypothetical protein
MRSKELEQAKLQLKADLTFNLMRRVGEIAKVIEALLACLLACWMVFMP